MIGLCGAHRTGKTTLAMDFGKEYEIAVVQVQASKTFERLGASPKVNYGIEDRLAIQTEILKDANKLWIAANDLSGGMFVSDRTPMDMLAYTLADFSREMPPAADEMLKEYSDRCFEVLNRHFSLIVNVPPNIPVVEAEGKAPGGYGYVQHIHSIILGLFQDERLKVGGRMLIKSSDRKGRVKSLNNAWKMTADRFIKEREQVKSAGLFVHQ